MSTCHLVNSSRRRAAPSQIAVKQQQRRWLAAGHLQLLDDLAGVLFFLNLLGDEPLQQRLGGVVAFFQRQLVQPMDQGRDFALVLQRLLEHIQRRLELACGLIERLKLHAAAAIIQEIEELHGVRVLLLALHAQGRGEHGQGVAWGVAAPSAVEEAIAAFPNLTDEQEAMVRRVTTSGWAIDVVIGRPGSGKTSAGVAAARVAWARSGMRVIGTSLQGGAKEQLRA